jgi:thiol-disulfide isomerase/thioredoxin
MKKSLYALAMSLFLFSCSKAQKTTFSTEALSSALGTTAGNTQTFQEILEAHKGKVTLVEIWASWCSDCVKAMPKLKAIQAEFPQVNYVFLSADKTPEKWAEGIAKHQLQGDHYLIPDGMKGSFGKSIDLDWIPRYIILDANGKIITYRAIETDFETIKTTLKSLN